MNIELPQTARIHELVRALEQTPNDAALKSELVRLEHERRQDIDRLMQHQAIAVSDAVGRQLEAEDRTQFPSLRMQYRAACKMYGELQVLTQRNRELKKALRDAL